MEQNPSGELIEAIVDFVRAGLNLREKFDRMVELGRAEGFEGETLKLLIRPHMKKMGADRYALKYYLKELEDSTGQYGEIPPFDYKILPEDIQIIHGDCREEHHKIPDCSTDLIFTDPPYDIQSLPLYDELAIIADRILKPGGSLLTYAGQYALPDILNRLLSNSSELKYWWMICVKHTGNRSEMFQRKIDVKWKPLLWLVKGKPETDLRDFVEDYIESEQPDKSEHEWAQSIKEALHSIQGITRPGNLVVDPFMGSGTTGIAAIMLDRQFIGIEKDQDRFAVAKARLQQQHDKQE